LEDSRIAKEYKYEEKLGFSEEKKAFRSLRGERVGLQ